jgi:hypothetical protein
MEIQLLETDKCQKSATNWEKDLEQIFTRVRQDIETTIQQK